VGNAASHGGGLQLTPSFYKRLKVAAWLNGVNTFPVAVGGLSG
jgi:hypothetical protein